MTLNYHVSIICHAIAKDNIDLTLVKHLLDDDAVIVPATESDDVRLRLRARLDVEVKNLALCVGFVLEDNDLVPRGALEGRVRGDAARNRLPVDLSLLGRLVPDRRSGRRLRTRHCDVDVLGNEGVLLDEDALAEGRVVELNILKRVWSDAVAQSMLQDGDPYRVMLLRHVSLL